MSYEVTATRRRPKTFDELAGQQFVSATLKSSIENGSIAHAYLFSGPRGCGKTSAARILARSLNCEKGPAASPCGVCAHCTEIAKGASLDVIEIDGASNTSVNDVRQIKDEVLFPPNSSRYKIYIIDEVHMLSNGAFNALLKTIEEPPPYVIFIFATTEMHKVPATIKSRCQQFAFKLIPIETITQILKDTCAEMGIKAEDEALFWVARESTGSLRDAYTLFDQVASFADGHIRAALIREKLGLTGLDNLNSLTEACVTKDAGKALLLLDGIIANGVAIEQFVIDYAGYFRSLLLLKSGVTRESLLGYPPERFSAAVRDALNPRRLERALELTLNLYRNIRYSVSPRFELEVLISALCALPDWLSQDELREMIAQTRAALGVTAALPAAASRQAAAPFPPQPAPQQTAAPFPPQSAPQQTAAPFPPQSAPQQTAAPFPPQAAPQQTAAPFPPQPAPQQTAAPFPPQSAPQQTAAPFPPQAAPQQTAAPFPPQAAPFPPQAAPQQAAAPFPPQAAPQQQPVPQFPPAHGQNPMSPPLSQEVENVKRIFQGEVVPS